MNAAKIPRAAKKKPRDILIRMDAGDELRIRDAEPGRYVRVKATSKRQTVRVLAQEGVSVEHVKGER